MKKIFLLFMMIGSIACYSQEKSNELFNNTDDYIKIKSYYKKLIKSGDFNKIESLRRELIDKIGLENKDDFINSKTPINEWIQNNFSSTHFKSIEEANVLLNQLKEFEDKNNVSIKEMLPIFSKITGEVGYAAFFKQINKDLLTELENDK